MDDDLRKKLDERKYVSLSGDRIRNNSSTANEHEVNSIANDAARSITVPHTKPEAKVKEEDMVVDNEPSDDERDEDTEIPDGSLFEFKIPGVLRKEEVELLNLGSWKLHVRNTLIDLEVSILKRGTYRSEAD